MLIAETVVFTIIEGAAHGPETASVDESDATLRNEAGRRGGRHRIALLVKNVIGLGGPNRCDLDAFGNCWFSLTVASAAAQGRQYAQQVPFFELSPRHNAII